MLVLILVNLVMPQFLVEKHLWSKNVKIQQMFWSQINVCPKKSWSNNFWSTFWSKEIWVKNPYLACPCCTCCDLTWPVPHLFNLSWLDLYITWPKLTLSLHLTTLDLTSPNLTCWIDLYLIEVSFLDLSFFDLSFLDLYFLDLSFLDLSFLDLSFLDLSFLDLS